jgi:hypothetical protein
VLRDGLWAGMEGGLEPHLDLTVCPTPYCRCHMRSSEQLCESLYFQDNAESDQQCHPLRNGEEERRQCGRCGEKGEGDIEWSGNFRHAPKYIRNKVFLLQ